MSHASNAYRWESRAELATALPEEAAIYYEWLLGLPAGSRPGEALRRIGVAGVRAPEGGASGWIPVFYVDDLDAAVGRLAPGSWRTALSDEPGSVYVVDDQGSTVRLRTRKVGEAPGPANSLLNFDCSALDVPAAVRFYSGLLGLQVAEVAEDAYDMRFLLDSGDIVAGVFQLSGIERFEGRSIWITYFEVASVEESVTRAVQSGSRVRIPPVDSPVNRYAVLDDPWGNLYGFSHVFAVRGAQVTGGSFVPVGMDT
ncbi:MAG: hypothetical protein KDB25_01400 [Leucobacter sp.]|nr:hypothetical protein [Leucobacter sp.]